MKKAFVRKESRFPSVQSFRPSSKREPLDELLPDISPKETKLDLKDLKWQDKERILRVLFAKMNGLSVVRAQAQHAYDSNVPMAPTKQEISAYRGGEYPTGAEAFTGSMADRVDRIISIDDDHGDSQKPEPQQNIPLPPEEPRFEMDVVPPMELPSITMSEDESSFSLPPILVVPEE